MKDATELYYALGLIHAPEVGPGTAKKLNKLFPKLEGLFKAPREELLALKIAPKIIESLQNTNWRAVEADLNWLKTEGNHLISLQSESYPKQLKEITNPPFLLYIKGEVELLNTQQIAVVGSRNPTPLGKETAFDFAKQLSLEGFTITSGLALGIDGASHEGALAGTSLTVAVMGTGLEKVYPRSHKKLAEKIYEKKGVLVSEFSPQVVPNAENFPRRNRIISGLSLGVLVVEAAPKSGSLITAKYALEQGREVFAIPGSIHNPLAKGCHALIKDGAKLVESIEDILVELPTFKSVKSDTNSPASTKKNPASLDTKQSMLVECVGFETTPIELLQQRSGLLIPEISSMLVLLELQGHLKSVPGGYIRARKADQGE